MDYLKFYGLYAQIIGMFLALPLAWTPITRFPYLTGIQFAFQRLYAAGPALRDLPASSLASNVYKI